MSSLKNNFSFLNFSPKKNLGILVLIFLLLFLISFRYALPFLSSGFDKNEEEQLAKEWQNYLLATTDSGKQHFIAAGNYEKDTIKKVAERFLFDPNKISKEDLIRLGLPMRTVYTWINYREKGGHFYKKTDLKKLYTLSNEDYEQIAPYARFPESENKKRHHPDTSQNIQHAQVKIKKIPLNQADTTLLKTVPGIGSVLASRIVAFRNALGGFYSVNQLREIYNLPDSIFKKNKERFTVNPSLIKQLNINQADYKTLTRHPYLRPYASDILKLRKKTGKFTDINQLKQISLINEQKYRKIAPYLTL